MKLPHLKKPKNELIGHQRKDENLKKRYDQIRENNGNKFPNTYLEDKRTVRGPLQMAKKRPFKRDEEVLLLSPKRGSLFNGKYIGPYVVSQKIDEKTYRIDTPEERKKTQVCHINRLKKCLSRRTACSGSSHRKQNSGKEGGAGSEKPASQA